MFLPLHQAVLLLLANSIVGRAQWTADSTGFVTSSTVNQGTGSTAGPLTTPAPITSTRFATGTCAARTINYLTHSLLQQCLRQDRISTNATWNPEYMQATTGSAARTNVGDNSSSVSTATLKSSGDASPEHLSFEKATDTAGVVDVDLKGTDGDSSGAAHIAHSYGDENSPLDNAKFLSFEEWKKQNLAQVGQSPENLGQGHSPPTAERPRPGLDNVLESFGDENEIELDFAFGRASPIIEETVYASPAVAPSVEGSSTNTRPHRSKDAGKTCKERTNYASFDCAANVLKSNPECKSAASVLVEHKDSYMLNICSATNKFFIVELCDDIQIDTIVLANYEFFSSVFRQFRVSVSDRYPVKLDKWKDLGTFEARNTREIQAFLVENPLIWARYLRIEILSHYGNEYYCPISLLRVHGTTMMQDYRHEEELARGEVSDDVETGEVNALPTNVNGDVLPLDVHSPAEDQARIRLEMDAEEVKVQQTTPTPTISSELSSTVLQTSSKASLSREFETCSRTPPSTSETMELHSDATLKHNTPRATSEQYSTATPTESVIELEMETSEIPESTVAPMAYINASILKTYAVESKETIPHSVVSASIQESLTAEQPGGKYINSSSAGANTPKPVVNTPTSPQMPQPSTQESFFKSINKRLQQLESNSTLSLQYIEEQSRILRDAFTKVDKRQSTNAVTFLSNLNETVMTELRGFRQAYDHLWQSTVLELETHREQYQREMSVLSGRLSMVADELVWQKRMGILQSTLLLLCLGLVLFSRQATGILEGPLVQQMVNRSQAAIKAGWESEPSSPPRQKGSPVNLFRNRLWRSSPEMEQSADDSSRPPTQDGLDVRIEPPTPPHVARPISDEDHELEQGSKVVVKTRSSPATPTGNHRT